MHDCRSVIKHLSHISEFGGECIAMLANYPLRPYLRYSPTSRCYSRNQCEGAINRQKGDWRTVRIDVNAARAGRCEERECSAKSMRDQRE